MNSDTVYKIDLTVVHGHFGRYFTFSVTVTVSVMYCSSKVILNDIHRASQFGQGREWLGGMTLTEVSGSFRQWVTKIPVGLRDPLTLQLWQLQLPVGCLLAASPVPHFCVILRATRKLASSRIEREKQWEHLK